MLRSEVYTDLGRCPSQRHQADLDPRLWLRALSCAGADDNGSASKCSLGGVPSQPAAPTKAKLKSLIPAARGTEIVETRRPQGLFCRHMALG
jgi:hypothetical protein